MSVGWKRTYTDEHIKTFVSMWHNGHTAPEIANALNKSVNSIRQFASRHREQYDLEKREAGRHVPRDSFDKLWHGVIPCGHWMITKPWGKSCVVKPVINC